MEGSENSKVEEHSLKEKMDDSEQVEVEEVDFGEVIDRSPETVAKQDEPDQAVEVLQAEEKDTVEKSGPGSPDLTIQEKEVENMSPVSDQGASVQDLVSSGNEQKQDENNALVDEFSTVASDPVTKTLEETALPISETNVEGSSGVDGSVSEGNVVDSSQPVAVPAPGDATSGGGNRDLSEVPSSQVVNLVAFSKYVLFCFLFLRV